MEVAGFIAVGLVSESIFVVESSQTAAEVGSGPAFSQDGEVEVLSTPSLVAFMERLSFQMLEERLPPGLTSLGVLVQVSHKAPSLVGTKIRLRSEVTAVAGRRVTLQLQAWEDRELVGEGMHQRVVVDREGFLQRLKEKRGE